MSRTLGNTVLVLKFDFWGTSWLWTDLLLIFSGSGVPFKGPKPFLREVSVQNVKKKQSILFLNGRLCDPGAKPWGDLDSWGFLDRVVLSIIQGAELGCPRVL